MDKASSYLTIDGILVAISRKRIKNLNLRISSPGGQVRVSVPLRVRDAEVRRLIGKKLDWIRRKQQSIASHPRRPKYSYVNGEMHPFFGEEFRLDVVRTGGRETVELTADRLLVNVYHPDNNAHVSKLLENFYRRQLSEQVPERFNSWRQQIGVDVDDWRIKRMKTRWGSCNTVARRIWLNLELARRPLICLDYILVHELLHLIERGHNKRFYALMDRYLPHWRLADAELRKIPLRED